MKKFLCLIGFVLSVSSVFSQIANRGVTIPMESLHARMTIMAFDQITPIEANRYLEFASTEGIKENILLYNLVLYRKINNEIEKASKIYLDSNLVIMRERDINESENVRFVICSEMNRENVLKENYKPGYYIYDRELDLMYSTVYKIEDLLKTYTLCKTKFAAQNPKGLDQNLVSAYAKYSLPKYKAPSTAGPQILAGLGFGLLFLISGLIEGVL